MFTFFYCSCCFTFCAAGEINCPIVDFRHSVDENPENFASLLCGGKEKRINRAALIDKQRNNAPAGLFCWAELENDFGPGGVVFIVIRHLTTMELEL